jgi:hypothetical protein
MIRMEKLIDIIKDKNINLHGLRKDKNINLHGLRMREQSLQSYTLPESCVYMECPRR